MSSNVVYRYKQNGIIVYIGKTDDLQRRISQHKKESKFEDYCTKEKIDYSDFDIDYVEVETVGDRDALEAVLIYKYRPILNDTFNSKTKENYVTIEDHLNYKTFCRERSRRQKEAKRENAIALSKSKYRDYLRALDELKQYEIYEKWFDCALNRIDYVCSGHELWPSIPLKYGRMGSLREHKYSAGEKIPCNVITCCLYLKVSEVEHEYECYKKYTEAKSIELQQLFTNEKYNYIKELDLSLDECEQIYCNYIDEVCKEERLKEEKRQREEKEYIKNYDKRLKEYVYSNQPIYMNISFEKKDTFKKWGCKYDPNKKKWYVTESTWGFNYNNRIAFFNRMIPKEMYAAVKAGLVSIDEMSRDARIEYKRYAKNLLER